MHQEMRRDKAFMERSDPTFPLSIVVCPLCKGTLTVAGALLTCRSCGKRFSKQNDDWIDLLPEERLAQQDSTWKERQGEMEAWYHGLIADADWAVSCFANDYAPFASMLVDLRGTVLDLGGGNGVVRHYLAPEVQYVIVEPSLTWLGQDWHAIADVFPCLAQSPPFVRGVGEYLPFASRSFDAVLAFWSLNHVSCPEQVLQEVGRVLKPGGQFLAVLEDMEPRWLDLLNRPFRHRGRRYEVEVVATKLRSLLPGQAWPLQTDHIRVYEADLRTWSTPHLAVVRRAWIGGYLTYVFRKPAAAGLKLPA